MVADITDGSQTINFHLFESVAVQYTSAQLFVGDRQFGQGQEVIDSGKKVEMFTFTVMLKQDVTYPTSGKSAYLKYERFLRMARRRHPTYDYQRKLRFEAPDGSGAVSVNGKLTKKVTTKMVAGDNDNFILLIFDFAPDDVAPQVP